MAYFVCCPLSWKVSSEAPLGFFTSSYTSLNISWAERGVIEYPLALKTWESNWTPPWWASSISRITLTYFFKMWLQFLMKEIPYGFINQKSTKLKSSTRITIFLWGKIIYIFKINFYKNLIKTICYYISIESVGILVSILPSAIFLSRCERWL